MTQTELLENIPNVQSRDDLTPEFVNQVLLANGLIGDERVVRVDKSPIGNGMIALNLRLDLQYDTPTPSAPSSLVVKMSAETEESRASGNALGLYEREVMFYRELATDIPQGLPKTLLCQRDESTGSFALVFENLAPARDGDQLAGCSVDDAKLAVKMAALMHSRFWNNQSIANKEWVAGEAMRAMYIEKLPAYVPTALQRFEQYLLPEVAAVVEGYADCIGRYFENCFDSPLTVTHQDYRLDNVLFDARNGELPLAVLDWQTFRPAPGPLDAAYFVGAGLLQEHRQPAERELAQLYFEELQRLGVQDYNWEQCWRDYRIHAAHGLIMGVVGAAITTPTERGDQMLSTMINRHAQQMIDLDTLALINE